MRQQLRKALLRILLNHTSLPIPLPINSPITTRRIKTLCPLIQPISKIRPRSIQLMTHARRIFARVIDRVAIDVVVEVGSNLGEVLGRVVFRVTIGNTRIGSDCLVPDITIGEGEAVPVVAVHGFVGEPGIRWVAAAEDGVSVTVATATTESVHRDDVKDVAASSWR